MDNATRRQLLQRHRQSGFPGSIIDVYKAYDQGIDLIGQFQQQQELQKPSVASTPQEQEAGLRPAHQAGNVNQSMVFPNVSPNASFNTVGMKAPIDIKQFSPQGNLVRSFDAVPPGVTNLKMGSEGGMVLETPAQMQSGGVRKAQNGLPPLTLGQTSPDWKAAGPGLRIDGQTYQNSQLTGSTRVPLNPETGDQLPIMLPAAEVVGRRNYDDSIAEAVSRTNSGLLGSQTSAQDYAQMENAVRSGMNTAGNNMLAAAGDVLSSPQRYAVNAPLAYAMGKTPNLSMFPSADRNLGINQSNAFPSETLGVTNPIGAFAVDALTDPTAIAGIGALGRAGISRAKGLIRNAAKNASSPVPHDPNIPQSLRDAQGWMYNWSNHPETRQRTAALTVPHPLSEYEMTMSGGQPISEYVDNFDYAIKSEPINLKNVDGVSSVHNPGARRPTAKIAGNIPPNSTIVAPGKAHRETTIGIHELTHSQYPQEFIGAASIHSEFNPATRTLDYDRNMFMQGLTDEAKKNYSSFTASNNNVQQNYLGYLADPTEQHARVMQLRHMGNLKPGQVVDESTIEKLRAKNLAAKYLGRPVVDDAFFDIYSSPARMADMFNRLPGLAPIAGGALATGAGVGLLNDNTAVSPQMKTGGARKYQKKSPSKIKDRRRSLYRK